MNKGCLEEEIDWMDTVSLSVRFDKDQNEELESKSTELQLAESETTTWTSRGLEDTGGITLESGWHGMSRWSRSPSKRLFDCVCVILASPVIIPLLLVIAAMVCLTSRGPILFLQERVGRGDRIFKIIKFRTMMHLVDAKHHPITTSSNQQFTSIGPLLRRLKLDELPQVVNVLLGHMSLVGPRPKMPEHVFFDLPSRPGITGLATIVFASEEVILARVPKDCLNEYYHTFVLPMKQQLDADYMACATFLSDLRILVNSILRRWDGATFDNAVIATTVVTQNAGESFKWSCPEGAPRTSGLEYMAELMRGCGLSAD